MSNKRKGGGRKETFDVLSHSSSLPLLLSPRLSDKVLSSAVGPSKNPPAEPHTKTVSLSLPFAFSLFHTHTHTCACTDTHTTCGALPRLGPWP